MKHVSGRARIVTLKTMPGVTVAKRASSRVRPQLRLAVKGVAVLSRRLANEPILLRI